MITWYNSNDLRIFFDSIPCVSMRYILPSDTEQEIKSKKKYPFINKKDLIIKIDYSKKNKTYQFIIPKGYCFDGASVPRFFWRIIGSNTDNNFLIAAMVHDYLCENHSCINNDRSLSSEIFNALLEVSNVFFLKRFFMKNSVNLFQKIFCSWK